MKKEITVDKAIKTGQLLVNLPSMIVMVATLVLCFYLGIHNILPYWIIPLGFFLAFIFSWFCWSILITKWRLWAFENVRNVHELKKKAIENKLIWNDGCIFEKTEIRSKSDKLKWAELQQKFKKNDIYYEDKSIPNSTHIYFSKLTNYTVMGLMLALLTQGIYLIVRTKNLMTGILFSLIGAYYSITKFRQASNSEPQIIIDNNGIKTINTNFKKWNEITNEKIIYEDSDTYLFYMV